MTCVVAQRTFSEGQSFKISPLSGGIFYRANDHRLNKSEDEAIESSVLGLHPETQVTREGVGAVRWPGPIQVQTLALPLIRRVELGILWDQPLL